MTVQFTPDKDNKATRCPYFEEARASDGWTGQASHKPPDKLRDELIAAIARLGASITNLTPGTFTIDGLERPGIVIEYVLAAVEGKMMPGKISLAALPVHYTYNRPKSQKMLYFVARDIFKGMWMLQQLSPGFASLLPFLMVDGKQTLSEMWSSSTAIGKLLPPGDAKFIEGDFKELP